MKRTCKSFACCAAVLGLVCAAAASAQELPFLEVTSGSAFEGTNKLEWGPPSGWASGDDGFCGNSDDGNPGFGLLHVGRPVGATGQLAFSAQIDASALEVGYRVRLVVLVHENSESAAFKVGFVSPDLAGGTAGYQLLTTGTPFTGTSDSIDGDDEINLVFQIRGATEDELHGLNAGDSKVLIDNVDLHFGAGANLLSNPGFESGVNIDDFGNYVDDEDGLQNFWNAPDCPTEEPQIPPPLPPLGLGLNVELLRNGAFEQASILEDGFLQGAWGATLPLCGGHNFEATAAAAHTGEYGLEIGPIGWDAGGNLDCDVNPRPNGKVQGSVPVPADLFDRLDQLSDTFGGTVTASARIRVWINAENLQVGKSAMLFVTGAPVPAPINGGTPGWQMVEVIRPLTPADAGGSFVMLVQVVGSLNGAGATGSVYIDDASVVFVTDPEFTLPVFGGIGLAVLTALALSGGVFAAARTRRK